MGQGTKLKVGPGRDFRVGPFWCCLSKWYKKYHICNQISQLSKVGQAQSWNQELRDRWSIDCPTTNQARARNSGLISNEKNEIPNVFTSNRVEFFYCYRKYKNWILEVKFVFVSLQNGDTALHISAALKQKKITGLLLSANIDTSIRNNVTRTWWKLLK